MSLDVRLKRTLAKKFEAKELTQKRAGRLPTGLIPTSARLDTDHYPTCSLMPPTTGVVDEVYKELGKRLVVIL